MSASDLRAAMGISADPEFDMTLPPGWSRRAVDDETFEIMVSGLKQRLMQAHKIEMYAETRRLLKKSFDDMRANGATAFFVATEKDNPATLWMPASMIASIRRAEPGTSLDAMARELIRGHGATPLLGDIRTLRYEKEKRVQVGSESVRNWSVTYLLPIPGTNRRRALQLVAGFGAPLSVPQDDPKVLAIKHLFDTCVSTVRWRADSASVPK